MDHAHMDHSGMSHSGMDHGDMDHGHGGGMKDMCSMNMLFTWDTTNLCIVFRQWHVRSTTSLFFSLVAVIFLAVGYEALRSLSRQYEEALDNRVRAAPSKLLLSPPRPHKYISSSLRSPKNKTRMLLSISLPCLCYSAGNCPAKSSREVLMFPLLSRLPSLQDNPKDKPISVLTSSRLSYMAYRTFMRSCSCLFS